MDQSNSFLDLLCHDKKDVSEVQIKIPIEEASLSEPRIEVPAIVFQAENDIGHGVDLAVHPLAPDGLDLETASA